MRGKYNRREQGEKANRANKDSSDTVLAHLSLALSNWHFPSCRLFSTGQATGERDTKWNRCPASCPLLPTPFLHYIFSLATSDRPHARLASPFFVVAGSRGWVHLDPSAGRRRLRSFFVEARRSSAGQMRYSERYRSPVLEDFVVAHSSHSTHRYPHITRPTVHSCVVMQSRECW